MHTNDLIAEMRQFLAETGLSPTRFGVLAAKNRSLVANIERGTSPTLRTVHRIRSFMSEYLEQFGPRFPDVRARDSLHDARRDDGLDTSSRGRSTHTRVRARKEERHG